MIKQFVRHWAPAVFCALVVYVYQRDSDRVASSQYILLWIPMCFFFVAAATYTMQKQIRELQAEVKELRSLAAEVPREM